ncbi:antichymotrypsin-2-like [Spodoptera frugiperda]|uniref:Antichymotrypsin-2-like n=1 Tax=Spodoptera frugiperda TaxID=7108 RepID=A0A9R0E8F2_SPOFR|nr:antichymotrypsin-2-like [Spodoptera frugiperda]
MFKSNIFTLFIFSIFVPRGFCELQFNNLHEKLVLSLIKAKPGTNVVASEVLVRLPLCKLASVAEGQAKVELMTALGYMDNTSLSAYYPGIKNAMKTMAITDLTLAHRIFVNYTKEIDPKFITYSVDNFGIRVEKVGFNYPKAATTHINNLISSITFKRITNILEDSDVNKQTQMIIVTAAHFKGTWEFPFDLRLTKLTKFQRLDGKVITIPMMSKTDPFQHVATGDCQAISIKFGNWRTTFTLVLPNSEQQLPALLDKIYNQKGYVENLVRSMNTRPMKVTFPRFKIKTFVDWTGFLKELGINSIFNATSSGLEGILINSTKPIALNKIKQKVYVQIDEVGVARFWNAINGAPQVPTQMPNFIDLPQFTADRPFYFEVSLDFDTARYKMFAGVYYGPEETPTNANDFHF